MAAGVGELQMQTATSPASQSTPQSLVPVGQRQSCLPGHPPHGPSFPFLCLQSTTSNRIQEVKKTENKNNTIVSVHSSSDYQSGEAWCFYQTYFINAIIINL